VTVGATAPASVRVIVPAAQAAPDADSDCGDPVRA
jgi:hypothetical protein